MKDGGADVAGRLDQRRVVVAHAAARQILGGLVFRERGLRHDSAREADAIGRHATIFVGGQIVRLDRRLVGRLGRAQPHEPAARRLQVAHARRERGKFVQWVAEFVERERLHVELDVGALARRIRARE